MELFFANVGGTEDKGAGQFLATSMFHRFCVFLCLHCKCRIPCYYCVCSILSHELGHHRAPRACTPLVGGPDFWPSNVVKRGICIGVNLPKNLRGPRTGSSPSNES